MPDYAPFDGSGLGIHDWAGGVAHHKLERLSRQRVCDLYRSVLNASPGLRDSPHPQSGTS
jgi:hypothetical protein